MGESDLSAADPGAIALHRSGRQAVPQRRDRLQSPRDPAGRPQRRQRPAARRQRRSGPTSSTGFRAGTGRLRVPEMPPGVGAGSRIQQLCHSRLRLGLVPEQFQSSFRAVLPQFLTISKQLNSRSILEQF